MSEENNATDTPEVESREPTIGEVKYYLFTGGTRVGGTLRPPDKTVEGSEEAAEEQEVVDVDYDCFKKLVEEYNELYKDLKDALSGAIGKDVMEFLYPTSLGPSYGFIDKAIDRITHPADASEAFTKEDCASTARLAKLLFLRDMLAQVQNRLVSLLASEFNQH